MRFTGDMFDVPPPCGNVLLLDADRELRERLAQVLVARGHRVSEAGTTAEAAMLLSRQPVDVVILDVQLPDGGGLELLSRIRSTSPISVLILTASSDSRDMREASERGAEAYLRKPIDDRTLEAQVCWALLKSGIATRQIAVQGAGLPGVVVQASSDLDCGLLDELPMVLARQLTHAWDLRHVETGAHVRRMAESARHLALALGVPQAEAIRVGEVAMLHDVGKIAIPDAILTKPGKLTSDEFEIMKRHSVLGEALLCGSGHPFLDLAARVARSHHERWNGSGYPDGLVGEACVWEARVVGVVDVYDALAETRCYKEGWSRDRIVDFFRAERGSSFDPDMTDALLSIVPKLELVKSIHPDPPLLTRDGVMPSFEAAPAMHHA